MNTSALKSFAPAVRRQLLEAVERKLDYVLTADTPDLRQAAQQVELLRKDAAKDRKGVIDRVAYTWFNRFAALRFLDARGWHPFRARVLTPATPEETQPEILKLLRTGSLPEELQSHTDLKRLNDLLDGRLPTAIAGADPQGEAYRGLILAACRFYHATMPFLFERVDDESELLLPDDLLTVNSVVEGFRTEISDEDCSEVEILGWLYQFYISEKKDTVMARKSAVPTEDIPAVTQLFTPHWIVRYLVENSLGRLWMLNHPKSKLRDQMPYYIEGESEADTDFLKIGKPEEIKLVDPAAGSGHMLTYAFDLLVKIYEEEGYAPSEIPEKILTHNLYGLEICPRAAQLTQFALVCKAREISRTAFRSPIQPQVICLQDISFEENELRDYIGALKLGELFSQPVLKLMHQFEQATNFGSLIQPCLDEKAIADVRAAIEGKDLGSQLFLRETHRKVLRVLDQAEALTQRYYLVVMNPPYLNRFTPKLKEFIGGNFECYKSDLFSAFVARGLRLSLNSGYCSYVTPNSWMYISSYEMLRRAILNEHSLESLVELSLSGFSGATVQLCTFVIRTGVYARERSSSFVRLVEYKREAEMASKTLEAICNRNCGWFYQVALSDLKLIPSSPIAYWISSHLRAAFQHEKLNTVAITREGMVTGNNEIFLRYWHEIANGNICQNAVERDQAASLDKRWFPYIKGGPFRKWHGNKDFVVDWYNDGNRIRTTIDPNSGKVRGSKFNLDFILKPNISWGALSSKGFSARVSYGGFLFDSTGPACFPQKKDLSSISGFLNSIISTKLLEVLNSTFRFLPGDIGNLPLIKLNKNQSLSVDILVNRAIEISKVDENNFETSWDFQDLPLLRSELKAASLEESWNNWEKHCSSAIRQMQELETENNRLFIEAYGLQDELSPEVPEDQITLACADRRKDVAALLSYAIGCMMGRYSLEKPGLILADAGDSVADYLKKVGKPLDQISYSPDEDGIIPVVEGEWFSDDIVARTREFLRVTFGESKLNENLRFIEESLGKSLEKYFLTNFYKDHLQTYKKRPIYWLFQSPKKGFSALVYMHRYTKDTCNNLLNGYLREYIKKIDGKISHLEHVSATADSAREKAAANKELEKLRKVQKECQDWERDTLLPLAQQRLEIDLDDGVKVNYLKFGNALATIPGLASKEEE